MLRSTDAFVRLPPARPAGAARSPVGTASVLQQAWAPPSLLLPSWHCSNFREEAGLRAELVVVADVDVTTAAASGCPVAPTVRAASTATIASRSVARKAGSRNPETSEVAT